MPSWAYANFLGAFFALCRLLVLPSLASANFLGAFFALCRLPVLPSWVPHWASWSALLGFLCLLGCLLGLICRLLGLPSWASIPFLGAFLALCRLVAFLVLCKLLGLPSWAPFPSWVPSWPYIDLFVNLLGLSLPSWVPSWAST